MWLKLRSSQVRDNEGHIEDKGAKNQQIWAKINKIQRKSVYNSKNYGSNHKSGGKVSEKKCDKTSMKCE